MRRAMLLTLALPFLGCGDPGADVDFGGEELGPDRHAIMTDDEGVKMGLTDRYVYFALADSVVEEARAEMRQEVGDEGAEGFFGGLVEKTVGKALGFRAKIPVDEIRDIRWEDGRMRIDFVDAERQFGDNFKVDDRPMDEAFREEDVRAMGEAFRELKAAGP